MVSAQSVVPPPVHEWQPELRADVIAARAAALELAAGVSLRMDDNLRLAADVGAGAVTGDGRGPRLGSRADLVGRFQPAARDVGWGPYLLGGLSYRADARSRGGLYLLAGVGVHAPAKGPIVPALEVALGGGVRGGVVMRW